MLCAVCAVEGVDVVGVTVRNTLIPNYLIVCLTMVSCLVLCYLVKVSSPRSTWESTASTPVLLPGVLNLVQDGVGAVWLLR